MDLIVMKNKKKINKTPNKIFSEPLFLFLNPLTPEYIVIGGGLFGVNEPIIQRNPVFIFLTDRLLQKPI
jgi:hypothetical protein